MRRMPCVLGSVAALFMLATAWPVSPALAQEAAAKIDPAVRPEFREPVTLASKDGVLEVRLIAKQGTATLDTVAKPVQNMLVFAYELIRGTASDGKTSGDNLYPAPTLQVFPGETLIIHLDNALTELTIKDFFDPAYTRQGRGGAALSAADDLFAAQPAYAWHPCQPKGERGQCAAAHPRRQIEHLHLQHSQEHAAGRLLVSLASAHAHRDACLLRHGRSARDRAHRRESAARYARTRSRSATCCCNTTTCSTGRAGARRSTTTPGRNG